MPAIARNKAYPPAVRGINTSESLGISETGMRFPVSIASAFGIAVGMRLSDRQWELIKLFPQSKKHATKEIFLYMKLINTVFQRCPRLVA